MVNIAGHQSICTIYHPVESMVLTMQEKDMNGTERVQYLEQVLAFDLTIEQEETVVLMDLSQGLRTLTAQIKPFIDAKTNTGWTAMTSTMRKFTPQVHMQISLRGNKTIRTLPKRYSLLDKYLLIEKSLKGLASEAFHLSKNIPNCPQ